MRCSAGIAVAGLFAMAAGFLGLDAAIAGMTLVSPLLLDRLVETTDALFLREISGFLLPALAVAAAALWWRLRGRFDAFAAALAWLVTVTAADLSKPLFGRPRPFQAEQVGQDWFAGSDFGSFPSGHTAWHLGLVLALAAIGGARWLWLLSLPFLVAAQRIVSHDHYLSDIGGSLLIAGLAFALAGRVALARFRSRKAAADA